MNPLTAGLLGFFIGAVVMEALYRMDAVIPEGWEDADGFHLGKRPRKPTPLQRRATGGDQDVIPLHEYAERNHHQQGV